jgi:GNAT superfamily N-acetyltransferase
MEILTREGPVLHLSRCQPARLAFEIRKAGRSDILEMRGMQERSMLAIGARHYARAEIEAFINLIGTMDDAVVDEGHFFIAIDPFERVIGTGAWSNLVPGYARHGAQVKPQAAGTAIVRSVYVAPECARRGIAQCLMHRIEADAMLAGMVELQLSATLSGESFYRAAGYAAGQRGHVVLPDGTKFGCVKMTKPLPLRASSAA